MHGGLGGEPAADLAVIFIEPLAQIVDQQGQVQCSFAANPSVGLTQRSVHFLVRRGGLDGPNGMFIDGVFVVVVKLHQMASVSNSGDQFLQHTQFMQPT